MSDDSKPETQQTLALELPEAPLVDIASGIRHNGNVALRDQRRVDEMAALFALGRGCKAVARLVGCSPQTARAVRNALESSGRLVPYKARLSGKLGTIIEDALDQYHEDLQAGEISSAQIPVHVGILSDKKALLDGDVTARIEHRLDQGLTTDALLERMRRVKSEVIDLAPAAAPIDPQSTGSGHNHQQSEPPDGDDATGDATGDAATPPDQPPPTPQP